MKEIFKLKTFWITFLLVGGIIFIVQVNLGHVYQTETDILVIPKNNLSVKNSDQIIENLKYIPLTLSFFEKVNRETGYVFDDSISELPNYKKQIYWKSRIKIVRIKKSGILKIITFGNNNYQAESLNKEVLKTFLIDISSYYNIKTTVDIRIINNPLTTLINKLPSYILILESFGESFGLVLLIFWLSFSFFKKDLFLNSPSLKNPFNYSQFNYHQSDVQNNLWLKKSSVNSGLFKKDYNLINKGKKAQAPNNLPMAPTSATKNINREDFLVEKKNLPKKYSEKEKTSKVDFAREATSEEMKAKLNSLLKGE